MEIALDKPGEEDPQLAKVTKRLKDDDGNPIGKSNKWRIYSIYQSDCRHYLLDVLLLWLAEDVPLPVYSMLFPYLYMCRRNLVQMSHLSLECLQL